MPMHIGDKLTKLAKLWPEFDRRSTLLAVVVEVPIQKEQIDYLSHSDDDRKPPPAMLADCSRRLLYSYYSLLTSGHVLE
jgi:hypothetical protein